MGKSNSYIIHFFFSLLLKIGHVLILKKFHEQLKPFEQKIIQILLKVY